MMYFLQKYLKLDNSMVYEFLCQLMFLKIFLVYLVIMSWNNFETYHGILQMEMWGSGRFLQSWHHEEVYYIAMSNSWHILWYPPSY